MSSITSEVNVDYLWQLHEIEGRSAQAALKAYDQWQQIEKINGTTIPAENSQYDTWGSLARISAVAAMAAVKKGRSEWRSNDKTGAGDMLDLALYLNTYVYPYGLKASDAKVKADLWEPVYGPDWAQVACVRDTIDLTRSLQLIMKYDTNEKQLRLESLAGGLLRRLADIPHLSTHQYKVGDREPKFAWIHAVESGDYPQAVASYEMYRKRYDKNNQFFDERQRFIITAKMIGRAMARRDMKHGLHLAHDFLKDYHDASSPLQLFALKQLIKNGLPQHRKQAIARNLTRWSNDAKTDTDFIESVQHFKHEINYIGLSPNEVVSIYNGH